MSVADYNTFIARIRTKLLEEISDFKLMQKWFDRIITIEYLQAKKLISCLKKYNKEEVIKICSFQNEYFSDIFKDKIIELEESFPNHFYTEEIISLLKENITCETPIEKISDFQEDFKDHERYTNFEISNRNLITKVNENNITALTQIFTPNWICEYFVEETISKKVDNFQNLTILDPCMGTGQILIKAVDKLVELYQTNTRYSLFDIYRKIYNEQLYGFDIDNHAITLAKFILTLKAYEALNNFAIVKNQYKFNFITIDNYDITILNNTFNKAKLYGSLIRVNDDEYREIKKIKFVNEKLINICQKLNMKYDVVLTNPPYMGRKVLPKDLLIFLNNNYKYGKSELYTSFIERCLSFLKPSGYLGMITLHTWMFIKSFSELRKLILNKYQIKTLLHLGKNTFENLNAYNALACAFIIENKEPSTSATFFDLTKYSTLEEKKKAYYNKENIYKISQNKLNKLEQHQMLYWLNEVEYNHLLKTPKLAKYCEIRQGLATSNNKEYIRMWWEVKKEDIGFNFNSYQEFLNSKYKYAPYNKGGDQTKWYSASRTVIKFNRTNFEQLKLVGNHLPSKEYYFKEGITWSLFGFNSFNVRYKENGYVFDVSGSSLFSKKEIQNYILGYLSSNVAFYFLSSIAPTVNFQVGNIMSLPFIYKKELSLRINEIVCNLITRAKYLDKQLELSWNFEADEIFTQYDVNLTYEDNLNIYLRKQNNINNEIINKEIELNEIFNEIYNLNLDTMPIYKNTLRSKKEITKSLLSYLVGVVFGRYSIKEYQVKFDLTNYINMDLIILEIKTIITSYLKQEVVFEIENILNYSIEDYFKKYFIKEHFIKYNKLPIYWHKKINNKLLIGYYHMLNEDINYEKGIKENYKKKSH